MQRFGLALSGGGFRAAIYHLGVIRFLRDAGALSQVSHITSVSGGSVLGAHLVLNWDRYNGTDEEFQQVADELLSFMRLDVRNRIVRRFPLASMVNFGRRTMRMSTKRQYTRAGLLEQHYEKYLYGDTGLFRLPDRPRLYVLATNLSEGSLCAFHRDGMLLQRRSRSGKLHFEEIEIGLATVPMAVAASSAFPGFFPPLELRNAEVGAKEGEFGSHAFTDGGIYDNLGLRMFRYIQQAAFRTASLPVLGDVINPEAFVGALTSQSDRDTNTPLGVLARKISQAGSSPAELNAVQDQNELCRVLIDRIGQVARNHELYRDPVFQAMELTNDNAKSLMIEVKSSTERPALRDRVWLNRQIISDVIQQHAGRPCLRAGHGGFDGIMVSNAGAKFKVRADGGAGGLVKTALRSSDILMDRVNQLELESFQNTPGVIFFPITMTVPPSQDALAPHPQVQRHAASIRTDMDRFSDLEISALVQHGYCVARQVIREESPLPGASIPETAPWDPLQTVCTQDARPAGRAFALADATSALSSARELQRSATRRTVSTLLSWKDWPTYVWVPVVAFVLLAVPYTLYRYRETTRQQGYVLSAVTATSPLYRTMLQLLENGEPPSIEPVAYEEVESLQPTDFTGFQVLSDDRIYDLRSWTSDHDEVLSPPYAHSRMRVRRTEDGTENALLRLQGVSTDRELAIECRPDSLRPRYSRADQPDGSYHWELSLDFSRVPIGADTVLVLEEMIPSDAAMQVGREGRFQFSIKADTGLVRIWMLMPEGRDYEKFEISGFPLGHPELAEVVVPATTVRLPIGAIATFQLINPKHNYRYVCRWRWSEELDVK